MNGKFSTCRRVLSSQSDLAGKLGACWACFGMDRRIMLTSLDHIPKRNITGKMVLGITGFTPVNMAARGNHFQSLGGSRASVFLSLRHWRLESVVRGWSRLSLNLLPQDRLCVPLLPHKNPAGRQLPPPSACPWKKKPLMRSPSLRTHQVFQMALSSTFLWFKQTLDHLGLSRSVLLPHFGASETGQLNQPLPWRNGEALFRQISYVSLRRFVASLEEPIPSDLCAIVPSVL